MSVKSCPDNTINKLGTYFSIPESNSYQVLIHPQNLAEWPAIKIRELHFKYSDFSSNYTL
ncbi:uncharacterized protein CANTADRAFT_90163 [Suhomyces tanzawaensis NRRL Y-17324]|uniref:Uncharacterized protein n=1 Tax=Suhomyces tanzawaensis NRRL Y-17324 TaxID=984487 RepID=A0A1E4SHQ6_9ASCO|nr:uncharacterized protein CANTADRAFT_90163 [Suhomyces tanzawaensis NRRL Y-17324]ODV79048.1 hypothetical protein CANTADRAFT_90163 [Suhomyces tanzawaensis NRRL Y-17324]